MRKGVRKEDPTNVPFVGSFRAKSDQKQESNEPLNHNSVTVQSIPRAPLPLALQYKIFIKKLKKTQKLSLYRTPDLPLLRDGGGLGPSPIDSFVAPQPLGISHCPFIFPPKVLCSFCVHFRQNGIYTCLVLWHSNVQ